MKINVDVPVQCPHCGADLCVRLYDAKLGLNTHITNCEEINEGKNNKGWCDKQFIMSVDFSFTVKAAANKIPEFELTEVKDGQ